MSSIIRHIKSANGKSYDVKGNASDQAEYVSPAGNLWGDITKIDPASSAQEAMQKADAWGYNT